MSRRDALLKEMGLGPLWKLRAEVADQGIAGRESPLPPAADALPAVSLPAPASGTVSAATSLLNHAPENTTELPARVAPGAPLAPIAPVVPSPTEDSAPEAQSAPLTPAPGLRESPRRGAPLAWDESTLEALASRPLAAEEASEPAAPPSPAQPSPAPAPQAPVNPPASAGQGKPADMGAAHDEPPFELPPWIEHEDEPFYEPFGLPEGEAAPSAAPPPNPIETMDWDALEAGIKECERCGLCAGRKQAVPGVGDRQADWLFVGEGPGAEEDEKGEPFVGQAGRLLDNMLAAIDLKRGDDVYIANAVKCRPPNNRTPETAEMIRCHPWLARQIALIQPKLIVALGRPAAQTLLNGEVKIAAARSRLHSYKGIPLIVTYHPAYLLRNLSDKAKAWEDLLFARRTMADLKQKP